MLEARGVVPTACFRAPAARGVVPTAIGERAPADRGGDGAQKNRFACPSRMTWGKATTRQEDEEEEEEEEEAR